MDEQFYEQVLKQLGAARRYPGLEQLICLALANPDFAAQLLSDPATTLAYIPSSIRLSQIEYYLATSVTDATDIHDFAARLHTKAGQVQIEIT